MNNKVKFKGPMKHFMRWPLYLSVLVVLLDLLVFIVSVKAVQVNEKRLQV